MRRRSWITAGLFGTASFAVSSAGSTVAHAAGGGDPGTATPSTVTADPAVAGARHHPEPATDARWVHTWTAMPQLTEPSNMPPAPFTQSGGVLVDSTLRQTVHVSLGGAQVRLRLSNVFGGAPLPVTSVFVALPQDGRAGVDRIQEGTSQQVTFQGRKSVTVPVGQEAVSEPLELAVQPDSNLTVTMYLATGQASQDITSHPGSRTTSYLLAGDHGQDAALPGATTVEHWYFLSGVEVTAPGSERATVVLGDSLTDGRGSTTNGNDRWPDQLFDRLRANPGTAGVAVLNQGAGGNRVLNDGLGPSAVSRFDRDVLGPSGVTSVIVFEGINDIGTAGATSQAQQAVTGQLIAAYGEMITKAHDRGLKAYGATLTPFGGNGYDDPGGTREAARQAVNDWIRTSGRFDAVVDLDRAARDPQQPRRLNPAFDVGDHLHMNPAGYAALAGAFPVELFA
ncbi:SGNH/GDSL hydrolase family protein [Streptomyces odontomachi]|uniref:SGNH/GDSL hydrolase family protein n=1 Tax=Streptomyces odontomachi TaxID=2944940 RepID=UPI00210CE641|nr:SGNH/GDSL hydrolase family protein [Streptomyces sp. ODS25]